MRQLLPTPAREVDLVEAYAYPDDLDERIWLRANMVSSIDGAATLEGRSEGLSGPADKKVFGTLRGLCDAVIIGAGTARIEGYRALRARPSFAELRAAQGQRPAPVLAVVSRRLDLDPASPLFHGGDRPALVVTSETSDPEQRARLGEVTEVLVAGMDRVDPALAVDQLAARGLRRLLCEGGPHLLADVAESGRLDELCLTLTPRVVGGTALRITAGITSDTPYHLHTLLEEDGTLFARYVRA